MLQDADQEDGRAHIVLDMLDSGGKVVAEDVTHVAWTDAGGMSLLAAATRSTIAVITLHRQRTRPRSTYSQLVEGAC